MPIPPLPPTFDTAAEFPIFTRWDFFNHAGVSPITARSQAALNRYARQAADDAYLTGKWYKQAEHVRGLAAKLINADPSEIAFVKNTSEGLAFVANGLEWFVGDRIISTAVEYPSNVYPWMDLAQRFGVQHIMVPERTGSHQGRIPFGDIMNHVIRRTTMITLSHIEFASGYCHDLAHIGHTCHKQKILLCVDAIQSLGVVPVDVRAMNIDFLSADGHKWLLGPEGLGIFYCRKELIPRLRPEIGWMNVINAQDYGNYDFTLRPDAKRFECGSYNIPGVLALGAALELILEVGMPTITARILALTDQLADGLAAKGYDVFSPRTPDPSGNDPRSGIIPFTSPTHDHAKILAALEAQKIILVQREGRLRASPHFYNTPTQIARLLAALPNH
jgi:cysteine desulfurase / selenocysteine lyase